MPLAPLDFLPPVVAACFPTDLCGLHRLTIDARRAGGGLPPRFSAYALPQGGKDLGPAPVIAPLREIVIDAAFGQQVMRQHLPLAATPVQIQERIEYLTHIDLSGPASPTVAGHWNQGL